MSVNYLNKIELKLSDSFWDPADTMVQLFEVAAVYTNMDLR